MKKIIRSTKVGILAFVVLLSGCTLRGCGSGNTNVGGVNCGRLDRQYEVELTYWRLFEEESVMDEIIEKYEEENPRIKINVVQKNYESYQRDLENALGDVSSERPDIVQVRNDWIADLAPRLASADPEDWNENAILNSSEYVRDAFICANPTESAANFPRITTVIQPSEIERNFAPIVYQDTVRDNKVYGVTMYVETLGLYYNKDLLAQAGIIRPPETWEEFREYANRMTVDINGRKPWEQGFDHRNIAISGAAIGDSQIGVNRATDILAALMFQSGIEMAARNLRSATFDQSRGASRSGAEVLKIYTDFTNPNSDHTSWEGSFGGDIGADEAFRRGQVGMIVNYPHKLRPGQNNYWQAINSRDPITGRQPRFDLGVAKLPQFRENNVQSTYGLYFSEVVTSLDHPYESWHFLRYLTGLDEEDREETPVWIYAENTNLPASRTSQDFLSNQIDIVHPRFTAWRDSDTLEPLIKPFVTQISSARTWQKIRPFEIERVMSDMIISVQKFNDIFLESERPVGPADPDTAVSAGAQCVTQIMRGEQCELLQFIS